MNVDLTCPIHDVCEHRKSTQNLLTNNETTRVLELLGSQQLNALDEIVSSRINKSKSNSSYIEILVTYILLYTHELPVLLNIHTLF